jgi:myosin heavy subunit
MEGFPAGIFNLIDEACQMPGTDEILNTKIITVHAKNSLVKKNRLDKLKFTIVHTPREVEYTITDFRDKNRDELPGILQGALEKSVDKLVSSFPAAVEPEASSAAHGKGGGKNDKFLGMKFRKQMNELMEELSSSECHFVRCLKPNEQKTKWLFVPKLMLMQIQYLGILDTIKIRKDSYPSRRTYRAFFERYNELDEEKWALPIEKFLESTADLKAACEK